MRKLIASVFIFFSLSLFAQTEQDPSKYLKGIADKMIAVIQTNKEALKTDTNLAKSLVIEHLLPVIDTQTFAQRTLGSKTWNTLSEKQQKAFVDGYIQRVIDKYAKGLSLYDGHAFEFDKAEFSQRTGAARVRSTMIQTGTDPLDIDYYLSKESGSWLITNIIVAGVDMRKSYRQQFGPRINEVGIDEFIKELSDPAKSN
ncbi:MlaC/ttg2D family ABC transporter substrate-binding protein [Aliikangiella maris]|uniref:ABC transporter substrate-binding protein n=2 Tax=Aliikangiella maris TaxID=3162458 RepID=A0ABV3MUI3_9GAMM